MLSGEIVYMDVNLLTILFIGCFGAALFLSYQFWLLMHEIQHLRNELKQSMKSKENLRAELKASRLQEIQLEKALESCLHGGGKY